MAYELLALDDPPQAMENTQHTPKEEAQVPEAVPPLASHSDEVKQVPLYPLEAPQAELGKVTTLNTLSRRLPRSDRLSSPFLEIIKDILDNLSSFTLSEFAYEECLKPK